MSFNLNKTEVDVIFNNLNATANCTAATEWYDFHNFINNATFPGPDILNYTNSGININWLRASLPEQYQKNPQAVDFIQVKVIRSLTDGPLTWAWLYHAIWAIGFFCKGPSLATSIPITTPSLWDYDKIDCRLVADFMIERGYKQPGPTAIEYFYTQPWFSTAEFDLWKSFASQIYPNISTGAAQGWMINQFKQHSIPDFRPWIQTIRVACGQTNDLLCNNIGFSGNPDIGGIGVIGSFIFEASLATLFLVYWMISYTSNYYNKKHLLALPLPTHEISRRFSEACLDGAMFLSLGFSIALYIRRNSLTSYNILLALCCENILLPSLVIFSITSEKSQVGKRFWRFSLCLILSIAFSVYVHFSTHTRFRKLHEGKSTFEGLESDCFFIALSANRWVDVIMYYAPPVFGFVYLGYFVTFLTMRNPWVESSENSARDNFIWTALFAALHAVLLWFMIGALFTMRRIMKEIAGDSWQEAEWGFGQVLAIIAWVPVLTASIEESWTLFLEKNARAIAAQEWLVKALLQVNNRFFQWSGEKKKMMIGWNMKKRVHSNTPTEDQDILGITTQQPVDATEHAITISTLSTANDEVRVPARAQTFLQSQQLSGDTESIRSRRTV